MCHALLFPVQKMAEGHTRHVTSLVESACRHSMQAAGRGDILTRNLPVIIVVNLDTSEHVDRGLSDVRVFHAPVYQNIASLFRCSVVYNSYVIVTGHISSSFFPLCLLTSLLFREDLISHDYRLVRIQSMHGPGAASMDIESGAILMSSVSSVGVSMVCSESEVDPSAASLMEIVSSESSILSTMASVGTVGLSGVSGSCR